MLCIYVATYRWPKDILGLVGVGGGGESIPKNKQIHGIKRSNNMHHIYM